MWQTHDNEVSGMQSDPSTRLKKPYIPPQVRKVSVEEAKQFLATKRAPGVLEELEEEHKKRAKSLLKSA